jgi:DNA mismatch endonuclease (patch repair protein)
MEIVRFRASHDTRQMTDIYSPEKRSKVMAKIRGRDTAIERHLRSALHRFGLRFRKNVSTLPGRPDIAFPQYRTAVFVHGCFWHRHPGCQRASVPNSNRAFWKAKFLANVKRDKIVATALRKIGWHVIVVWECEIRKNAGKSAERIRRHLTH